MKRKRKENKNGELIVSEGATPVAKAQLDDRYLREKVSNYVSAEEEVLSRAASTKKSGAFYSVASIAVFLFAFSSGILADEFYEILAEEIETLPSLQSFESANLILFTTALFCVAGFLFSALATIQQQKNELRLDRLSLEMRELKMRAELRDKLLRSQ